MNSGATGSVQIRSQEQANIQGPKATKESENQAFERLFGYLSPGLKPQFIDAWSGENLHKRQFFCEIRGRKKFDVAVAAK